MMRALAVGLGAGQGVDSIVLGVAAVTLNPVPFDAVPLRRLDQLLPQLGILDWLPVRSAPAVLPQFVDPARDSVAYVSAVSVKLHPARPFQRLKTANRGEQLHAVVGGQRLAAG